MSRRNASESFGKELFAKMKKDRITNGAAALAFYWMLALFPAAIFVLTLLPYLPVQNLDRAIMDLLRQAMPGEAAGMFEHTVRNIVSTRKAGLLSFGLLFTVWTSSTGLFAVMQELNRVHDIVETRSFLKARGVAFLLTLICVVCVLGALALAVLGGVIQDWLGSSFGFSSALLFFFATLRWVIIAGALLLALAVVYTFGPAVPAVKERRFALITPGTAAGTTALALASVAFRLYVGHFGSYDKTYGSLGAVIALLMWLFVTGLVFLFGAEVDVLAQHRRRARRVERMRGGAHPQPA